MFGKLLKNDLKAQFHSVYVMFFIIVCSFVGLEAVSLFSKKETTVLLTGICACFVMLFAYVFVIISVAKIYSSTLFSKTGYLTLTLPVKTSKLIWSKTISGLIWVYVAFGLFIASFVLLAKNTVDLMGEEAVEAADSILELFGAPSLKTIFLYGISISIALAVSSLLIVQCLYFGITLSNVTPFSRLGKLGAVIFTVVCFFLIQKFSESIGGILPAGMVLTPDSAILTSDTVKTLSSVNPDISPLVVNFVSPAIRLVAACLLSFPISYLVKNEVNVQ